MLPSSPSVVAFASGGSVNLTTGPSGEAGQPCLLGFGSFAQLPGPLTAQLPSGAETSAFSFPLPAAASLTGVAAAFRSAFPLSLPGTVLNISLIVFAAAPGAQTFTPVAESTLTLSPPATGDVPAGQLFSAVSAPFSVSLPAGTQLLPVLYASASGDDPSQIVSGQASASLSLQL